MSVIEKLARAVAGVETTDGARLWAKYGAKDQELIPLRDPIVRLQKATSLLNARGRDARHLEFATAIANYEQSIVRGEVPSRLRSYSEIEGAGEAELEAIKSALAKIREEIRSLVKPIAEAFAKKLEAEATKIDQAHADHATEHGFDAPPSQVGNRLRAIAAEARRAAAVGHTPAEMLPFATKLS